MDMAWAAPDLPVNQKVDSAYNLTVVALKKNNYIILR